VKIKIAIANNKSQVITMKRSITATISSAIIIGIIAMVGINNLSILLNLKHGFYLALIIFLIMGGLFEFFAPPNTSVVVLLFIACGAIFVGVAVDAALDWLLRSFGRNLWGAEVLMWWLFAPIPLIIGIMVVRQYKKRRSNKKLLDN
jgi:hypothetical protein